MPYTFLTLSSKEARFQGNFLYQFSLNFFIEQCMFTPSIKLVLQFL